MRQVDPVPFIWNILQVQGEKLIKDGKVLDSPEANQAELRIQAQRFADLRLPLLERLGLV